MTSLSNGRQAELFVQRERMKLGGLVFPTGKHWYADICHLQPGTGPLFIEVKSSRIRSRALKAKLSPAQQAFRNECAKTREYNWLLYRVLTFPRKSKRACQLLQIENAWGGVARVLR